MPPSFVVVAVPIRGAVAHVTVYAVVVLVSIVVVVVSIVVVVISIIVVVVSIVLFSFHLF